MQTETIQALETEYAAAQTGSVLIDSSARGRVQLGGRTRLDFLHRMSTNDLLHLSIGQGAATIFLTPLARIIDRTIQYVRADDILMLTSRGSQGRIMAWLRKYIFFNDDVQLIDRTSELSMLSLYGPTAMAVLQALSGFDLLELQLHHWCEAAIGGETVMIARADPIGSTGFHVIVEAVAMPRVRQTLIEAGVSPISDQTYQVLRIEAGQPEYGHELTEDYIPLEAGLWTDVSFTKGCYTGQEIIARMESRQRLAKQLVGLRFQDEAAPLSSLFVEGSEVGWVTSVARSPQHGWIGLGYLKSAQAQPGQLVQSQVEEQIVEARVVALPFQ
jgi:folate-binding protein YgfZ